MTMDIQVDADESHVLFKWQKCSLNEHGSYVNMKRIQGSFSDTLIQTKTNVTYANMILLYSTCPFIRRTMVRKDVTIRCTTPTPQDDTEGSSRSMSVHILLCNYFEGGIWDLVLQYVYTGECKVDKHVLTDFVSLCLVLELHSVDDFNDGPSCMKNMLLADIQNVQSSIIMTSVDIGVVVTDNLWKKSNISSHETPETVKKSKNLDSECSRTIKKDRVQPSEFETSAVEDDYLESRESKKTNALCVEEECSNESVPNPSIFDECNDSVSDNDEILTIEMDSMQPSEFETSTMKDDYLESRESKKTDALFVEGECWDESVPNPSSFDECNDSVSDNDEILTIKMDSMQPSEFETSTVEDDLDLESKESQKIDALRVEEECTNENVPNPCIFDECNDNVSDNDQILTTDICSSGVEVIDKSTHKSTKRTINDRKTRSMTVLNANIHPTRIANKIKKKRPENVKLLWTNIPKTSSCKSDTKEGNFGNKNSASLNTACKNETSRVKVPSKKAKTNGENSVNKKSAILNMAGEYEISRVKIPSKKANTNISKKDKWLRNKMSNICHQCGMRFEEYDMNKLAHHKRKECTAKPIYDLDGKRCKQCPFCEKIFSSTYKLKHHIKCIHYKEKLYFCNECDMQFGYIGALKNHLLQHRGIVLKCKDCEEQFTTYELLSQHRGFVHGNRMKRRFVCDECGMRFITTTHLHNHKRFHLPKEEWELKCDQCTVTFIQHIDLKRHMMIHSGDKPFACEKCPYRSNRMYNLNKHMRSKHESDSNQPMTCELCDKQLNSPASYKKHLKTKEHLRRQQKQDMSKVQEKASESTLATLYPGKERGLDESRLETDSGQGYNKQQNSSNSSEVRMQEENGPLLTELNLASQPFDLNTVSATQTQVTELNSQNQYPAELTQNINTVTAVQNVMPPAESSMVYKQGNIDRFELLSSNQNMTAQILPSQPSTLNPAGMDCTVRENAFCRENNTFSSDTFPYEITNPNQSNITKGDTNIAASERFNDNNTVMDNSRNSYLPLLSSAEDYQKQERFIRKSIQAAQDKYIGAQMNAQRPGHYGYDTCEDIEGEDSQ